MGTASAPSFLVLHALRVKGFATTDVIVELSGVDRATAEAELAALQAAGEAQFREARSLWQLTPDGKAAHLEAVAADAGAARGALQPTYEVFLGLNERFKELCGEWQLKPAGGGPEPNDHSDAAYDAAVVAKLDALDAEAGPVCDAFTAAMPRYGGYRPRLSAAVARVKAGDQKQFTGVMCNSYHDVWMELHEDLILTLGIDRTKEGSF